jgi:hypothetical protein
MEFGDTLYLRTSRGSGNTRDRLVQDAQASARFSYNHIQLRSYTNGYNINSEGQGYLNRKLHVLPNLIKGVFRTVKHTVQVFIDLKEPNRKVLAKVHFYFVVRDLQNISGQIVLVFWDRIGRYIIENSQFNQECYAIFLNNIKNPVQVFPQAASSSASLSDLDQLMYSALQSSGKPEQQTPPEPKQEPDPNINPAPHIDPVADQAAPQDSVIHTQQAQDPVEQRLVPPPVSNAPRRPQVLPKLAPPVRPQPTAPSINKNVLKRVLRNSFDVKGGEEQLEGCADALIKDPTLLSYGVICLRTALAYYRLSSERSIHLEMCNVQNPQSHANVIKSLPYDSKVGLKTVVIDGIRFNILNRERCVIDAIRYFIPMMAKFVVANYLQSGKTNVELLKNYAVLFNVNIGDYLT